MPERKPFLDISSLLSELWIANKVNYIEQVWKGTLSALSKNVNFVMLSS